MPEHARPRPGVLARLVAIVIASAAGACGGPGTARPPRAPAHDTPRAPLLSLDVGPCLGRCPEYSVVVYDDGLLVFVGRARVAAAGERRARLASETLSAIVRAFDDARFFELDEAGHIPVSADATRRTGQTTQLDFRDDTVCGDTSHTRVSYAHAGRRRTIDDAHCEQTELSQLEASVLPLLGIETWITAASAQ